MELKSKDKFKLKKFVRELSGYRGRHTELVSVYVPAGYDLHKIQQHLSQEQGTASNIKSSATRKNVTDALERMIQHLKLFKQTPPNGLACFSGNVAEREGQSDVKVWSLEPPIPLQVRVYRCDKTFVTEYLEQMMDTHETYGLVLIDRRDGTIGLLKGKSIVILVRTHSEVPGKTRAGGQSAQRFERLRAGAKKDHFKKVAEYMKEQFLGMENLKGIIVGGPGPTKYDFCDGNYITNDVKKKIIAIKDVTYTDDYGMHELVEVSEDNLAAEEVMDEKRLIQDFLRKLSTDDKMVAYGKTQVEDALTRGAVDTLLLSESLDDVYVESMQERAEEFGTTAKIISVDTREGAQLRDIGKIAAILRYAID